MITVAERTVTYAKLNHRWMGPKRATPCPRKQSPRNRKLLNFIRKFGRHNSSCWNVLQTWISVNAMRVELEFLWNRRARQRCRSNFKDYIFKMRTQYGHVEIRPFAATFSALVNATDRVLRISHYHSCRLPLLLSFSLCKARPGYNPQAHTESEYA